MVLFQLFLSALDERQHVPRTHFTLTVSGMTGIERSKGVDAISCCKDPSFWIETECLVNDDETCKRIDRTGEMHVEWLGVGDLTGAPELTRGLSTKARFAEFWHSQSRPLSTPFHLLSLHFARRSSPPCQLLPLARH